MVCFKKEPREEPLNVLCINSPLRLRGLPDKMATSNGGGMEVDGAGEYLSLISSFLSTPTKTCAQVAVYVVLCVISERKWRLRGVKGS